MKNKKKLIVVEPFNTNIDPYADSGMKFSFVSSPDIGRKQCTDFYSCREIFCLMVKKHVAKDKDHSLDMKKMRLLITRNFENSESISEYKQKLFSGKKIINEYENLLGWNRSKITSVNIKKEINAWLLTGPGKWMSYPYLISLVVLIMRIAADSGPIDIKYGGDMIKDWKNFINKFGNNQSDDMKYYLKDYYEKIGIILTNFNKIFNDDLDTAYNISFEDESLHNGITSLCDCDTSNEDLNNRVRTILTKGGIKI